METSYKEKCPNCGAEIYYSDNEKLIKCTSCGNTLVVAEFVREQQKIEQQLAEGETAKAELAKAKQEKQKAQDALNETVRALDGIQTDQHVQRETLEQLLDIQYADKSLHDNMLLLLQTIQGEQRDENGFLNHLLYNIGAEQKTADEKLESISNIAAQLRQNQNNTEKMISVLNEHLSVSDREKKKLIDEYIEWQNNVHKEDVERLERIQNSSNSILNALKKMDDEIDRTHTEISKVEDAVKGFESKWETDRRKKLIAKYKTAEKLQKERRFDEAQKYYQDVLINGGQDPEVYWRVLMCHYCIEYQRDDEGKEIPTILYPDLSDPNEVMERINLLEILDNTEKELREYYCTKLKAIDTTLDKYRRWQYKHEYDVFISVKQTDKANGKKHPTDDYKVGMKLYDYLTSLGLKVFNSEKTKGPAGEEWEPYILAALMSARVMIVVGTCPEYMESQWVKNEWTRYQWLQKFEKDKNKKRLLFCYLSGGMTAEQLPKGLNPDRQAIIDDIGAQGELAGALSGIFSQIGSQDITDPIWEQQSVEAIKTRMEELLVNEEYDKVEQVYEEYRNQSNHNIDVGILLCVLCSKLKVSFIEDIPYARVDLSDNKLFRFAKINAKKTNSTYYLKQLEWMENENLAELKRGKSEVGATASEQSQETRKEQISTNEKQTQTRDLESSRESESNKEDATIYVQLGDRFFYGKDTKKDYEMAILYYLRAADLGDAYAQCNMGYCYEYGLGVEQDYQKAIDYYQKSADQGNTTARENLKRCYQNNREVKNDKNAIISYQKSADQGDADAQNSLGWCYQYGLGVEQNYHKAVAYYRRSARQGNADAQCNLGYCYEYGIGEKQDYHKAVEYYRMAAEQGNALGQNNLGCCYQFGLGVEQNNRTAVEFFRKSANQGNAVAQYNLGRCYQFGQGVERDDKKAAMYYQKSADQGNTSGQNKLGYCYEHGIGVEQDHRKAAMYYQKSADQGDASGQYCLGYCYEHGIGVERDYQKATMYYQKSADQGNALAQNNLISLSKRQ